MVGLGRRTKGLLHAIASERVATGRNAADVRVSVATERPSYTIKRGPIPFGTGLGVSPGKMKGLVEERRWKKDRDKVMLWSFSSHGEREGEAPRAWLVEGATQVPVIDRGKP